MDVKVFKTFLEVANTRHFGRAAEHLYITQAAVSARIKQLEEFVDAPLFKRQKNNISLTTAGERLIPYATTMVRAMQQVKDDISLIDSQLSQLSIAATPNVWDAYFQNYLTVVNDDFPDMRLRAEMQDIRLLHTSILNNTLDIGLCFDPFFANEVSSQQIAEISLILVSKEPGYAADELMASNYVRVDWGTQFALEHDAKYGKNSAPKLITSTSRIALDFILAKGGGAFLPSTLVEPFIENGELFRVKGKHTMKRSVYAVYQKHHRMLGCIEKVIEVIDQSSPQRPALIKMAANSG